MIVHQLIIACFWNSSYKECNLYQIMREQQRPFSEEEIRNFMSQVLQGLTHMHTNGYFHRDLKPGKTISFSIMSVVDKFMV